MSVERREPFILVALFLSRAGRQVPGANPLPPAELGTDSWGTAYAMFFDSLAEGRSLRSFHNSLKATRDQFDSHIDSGRRGWRLEGEPKPLPTRDARLLEIWQARSDSELWEAIKEHADPEVASVLDSVLTDLRAEPDDGEEGVGAGREGTVRAVISKARERSPRLRAAALGLHGYRCQVCGFSFEEVYGEWGRDFAEVHHLRLLSSMPDGGADVDPTRDLSVVCSNCHRMLHRKPKVVLTLNELRTMVDARRKNP